MGVRIDIGIAGLVAALVIGKRMEYDKQAMSPVNLILPLIGRSMLWTGWFGFNASSAIAADGHASMALAATQIATGTAAIAWVLAE